MHPRTLAPGSYMHTIQITRGSSLSLTLWFNCFTSCPARVSSGCSLQYWSTLSVSTSSVFTTSSQVHTFLEHNSWNNLVCQYILVMITLSKFHKYAVQTIKRKLVSQNTLTTQLHSCSSVIIDGPSTLITVCWWLKPLISNGSCGKLHISLSTPIQFPNK